MSIKKVLFISCLVFLAACGHKKPPLAPTQTVNEKSIVIPPEFDVVPEIKSEK